MQENNRYERMWKQLRSELLLSRQYVGAFEMNVNRFINIMIDIEKQTGVEPEPDISEMGITAQ